MRIYGKYNREGLPAHSFITLYVAVREIYSILILILTMQVIFPWTTEEEWNAEATNYALGTIGNL